MSMKLVTYDLHLADAERREELDKALVGMGFRSILETVWVGDTSLSASTVLSKMDLSDGDKALVVEVDELGDLAEVGLPAKRTQRGIDAKAIYARRNGRPTGKIRDFWQA